jgi:hypothetical protein
VAQTVVVAGNAEPMNDPFANHKTQEEVEKSIMKQGRFRLTQEAFTADLVIGVRKGIARVVNPTISGWPVDTRPATIETTDNQIRVSVQKGRPHPMERRPETRTERRVRGKETGSITQDVFEVFNRGDAYGVSRAPVWTYVANDRLKPPAVTALEKFRKTLEEAEKAARQKQQQGQKKNP